MRFVKRYSNTVGPCVSSYFGVNVFRVSTAVFDLHFKIIYKSAYTPGSGSLLYYINYFIRTSGISPEIHTEKGDCKHKSNGKVQRRHNAMTGTNALCYYKITGRARIYIPGLLCHGAL